LACVNTDVRKQRKPEKWKAEGGKQGARGDISKDKKKTPSI
jgi:hypothetical protein